MAQSPDPGEVSVHYQRTDALDATAVNALAALLSGDERARAARFAFDRDRRDFVAAHVLLRRVLSASCGGSPEGWRFAAGEFGKPALVAPAAPVSFNLAHTHGLAVCAIAPAGADVGVDVESVRPIEALDLADRFFAPPEIADLRRCSGEARLLRFIEIWTMKEAFVKALGTGLQTPLDAFAVSFDAGSGVAMTPPPGEDPARWRFALFHPGERDRIAVAVRGHGPWPVHAVEHGADGRPMRIARPARTSAARS